ncbi:uncharacterized protein LOC127800198 [Diospyros lotus]|uniref:uncharacterized protein LOC127800198 n=1 Tax=Diospyros lotus TaxID=55363 RepID=UPI002259536B|nr:uncharacterized protein LOC127800198 [Diospyros lotus]
MASKFTVNKQLLLASSLIYISLFSAKLGKADEDFPQGATGGFPGQNYPQTGATGATGGNPAQTFPQTGATGGNPAQTSPQTGATIEDPAQIVAKAFLCFNDKYIYSSCEEAYRLDQTGNLKVPPEHTEQFCGGPCLEETNLVLSCVDQIATHFEFYNKATIEDVRDTIKAGCGYGIHRGDFNVAEHIQTEQNKGKQIAAQIMAGFVWMILLHGLVL